MLRGLRKFIGLFSLYCEEVYDLWRIGKLIGGLFLVCSFLIIAHI